jgi:hypothetical protein
MSIFFTKFNFFMVLFKIFGFGSESSKSLVPDPKHKKFKTKDCETNLHYSEHGSLRVLIPMQGIDGFAGLAEHEDMLLLVPTVVARL